MSEINDRHISRLRVFRKAEGLTQPQLSAILDKNSKGAYPVSYISRIETRQEPVPPKIAKLIVENIP